MNGVASSIAAVQFSGGFQGLLRLLPSSSRFFLPHRVAAQHEAAAIFPEDFVDFLLEEFHLEHFIGEQFLDLRFGHGSNELKMRLLGRRHLEAARIVVASPTAALDTALEMRPDVDEFVVVMVPDEFYGVGQWYDDFAQTSEKEVRELLASAK